MATRNFNVKNGLTAGNITLDATTNTTTTANLVATGNVTFNGPNVSLGSVSNLKITGGTGGYVLSTDGAGNLSWTAQSTQIAGAYVFTQSTPATTWVVNHNLGVQYVNVQVIDATGNSYTGRYNYPTITFNNAAALTITFDSAVAGYAAVTSGGGQQNVGGANTQIQFNDANVLGGSAAFTFNKTSNLVSMGGALSVTGNANVGNLSVGSGTGGSLIGANLLSANFLTGTLTTAAQPNITSVGTLTSLVVTGNITGGNLLGPLANGNSNVRIATSNGNVTISAVGNNTMTITGTGANITGTANISGNANIGNIGTAQVLASANVTAPQLISNVATGTAPLVVTSTTQVANLNAATAGSATTAGTVTTAAQPNITSVGTLTGLTVSGSANLASSSGNVGIGTTSPKSKLQVTGLNNLNAPVLGNAANAPLYVTNSDSAYGLVVGTNASDGRVWLQAQRTDGTATAYNITLNEAGGNVGIGTTSPSVKLDVAGDIKVKSNIAYVAPNGANTINSTMLNGGTLAWSGNAGQLFSITDSMSGNIFNVNDVSGIPMISVDAGGNIQFAASGGFVNYGVTTAITAAGSTQGTATILTRPINVVSTVASGANGIILPTVPAGARIIIVNTSANALNVYPPSGAVVNSGSTNAAYSQPAGARLEYFSVSTTQWYTLNATYG